VLEELAGAQNRMIGDRTTAAHEEMIGTVQRWAADFPSMKVTIPLWGCRHRCASCAI
jgi:hypothetical protein